jgi:hypothetical protein
MPCKRRIARRGYGVSACLVDPLFAGRELDWHRHDSNRDLPDAVVDSRTGYALGVTPPPSKTRLPDSEATESLRVLRVDDSEGQGLAAKIAEEGGGQRAEVEIGTPMESAGDAAGTPLVFSITERRHHIRADVFEQCSECGFVVEFLEAHSPESTK